MPRFLQFQRIFLLALAAVLTACASAGPLTPMTVSETNTLARWDQIATQRDSNCYNLFTKYSQWGVFIGCQAIDIFDVRDSNLAEVFTDNLSLQSCSTKPRLEGQRNYIRTGEHLLFLDKTRFAANAWFVPAGYYSDGVSTPDFLREIVPGAILDTESPRTLSAALFHDRYFCLFEYTRIVWNPEREDYPQRLKALGRPAAPLPGSLPTAYRRKGCANISFRNGLRSAGASSIVSTIFRRMVGIVNPGKVGYCPQRIHGQALADLDRQLEAMLNFGPIGTKGREALPGCRAKEPVTLCLSRVPALWSLVGVRPDDYDVTGPELITDEWRQVFMRIMCYEIQARDTTNWPFENTLSKSEAETTCSFLDLNAIPSDNALLRQTFIDEHAIYEKPELVLESPFRAGDFFVEAALLLTQEGPGSFLRTVSSTGSLDFAMLAIVDWNMRFAEQSS